jgi:hypothetical protein
VAEEHEEREREEAEHPAPKFAPGPKLPKPAVPHVYVTRDLGFGWKERMPPQR